MTVDIYGGQNHGVTYPPWYQTYTEYTVGTNFIFSGATVKLGLANDYSRVII
jgi:hypothetical protein